MRLLTLLVAAILLVACQTTPQPVARTWQLPTDVKVVQANGYDMAYVERGAGVPVVFVHGAGIDYRYWVAQMEPFSERYRAIAVSLRHYYPEPWRGDGDFSLSQQVADLVSFIRQLGAGPVHLVGHSRGATVAIYATRAAPELVRTLTFAEGGAGMPAFAPTDPALAERRTVLLQAMTEKLKQGQVDAGLEIFMEYTGGPGAWKTTPERSKQLLRDNAFTLTVADRDTATWPAFSCEDANRIKVPVLLLGGESSPGNFGAALDKVQSCLTQADRQVIKSSSHSMPRINPSGFNAAVMTFIAAH
jgi:esterase